jgi:F-box domain
MVYGKKCSAHSSTLCALDPESLYTIFAKLDPHTVANLSCCCKLLRNVGEDARLWESFVRRRWHVSNKLPFTRKAEQPCVKLSLNLEEDNIAPVVSPSETLGHAGGQPFQMKRTASSPPAIDWHKLYTSENGWRGKFKIQELRVSTSAITAFHLFSASDVGLPLLDGIREDECVAAVGSSHGRYWLCIWSDAASAAQDGPDRDGSHDEPQRLIEASEAQQERGIAMMQPVPFWEGNVGYPSGPTLPLSVLVLGDQALFAVGTDDGSVHLVVPTVQGPLQNVRMLLPGDSRCCALPETNFPTPFFPSSPHAPHTRKHTQRLFEK